MNNNQNFINFSQENQQEPQKAQELYSSTDKAFLQVKQDNRKLTPFKENLSLSINDVRNLAILKYSSVSGFGRALGITHGMASRLLSGDYIPLRHETITRIAKALGIDPVQLSQIYSSLQNKICDRVKVEKTNENKKEKTKFSGEIRKDIKVYSNRETSFNNNSEDIQGEANQTGHHSQEINQEVNKNE